MQVGIIYLFISIYLRGVMSCCCCSECKFACHFECREEAIAASPCKADGVKKMYINNKY